MRQLADCVGKRGIHQGHDVRLKGSIGEVIHPAPLVCMLCSLTDIKPRCSCCGCTLFGHSGRWSGNKSARARQCDAAHINGIRGFVSSALSGGTRDLILTQSPTSASWWRPEKERQMKKTALVL